MDDLSYTTDEPQTVPMSFRDAEGEEFFAGRRTPLDQYEGDARVGNSDFFWGWYKR